MIYEWFCFIEWLMKYKGISLINIINRVEIDVNFNCLLLIYWKIWVVRVLKLNGCNNKVVGSFFIYLINIRSLVVKMLCLSKGRCILYKVWNVFLFIDWFVILREGLICKKLFLRVLCVIV